MPAPGPSSVRLACARCHAHKLGCPGRVGNEQSCSRCTKAGALCVFGTSVRGMRPAAVAASGLRTASDMDGDFTTPNKRARRASKTPTSPAIVQQRQPAPASAHWPPELAHHEFSPESLLAHMAFPSASDADNIDGHIKVVETLAKLNLDLLRHASTVPPHSTGPSNTIEEQEKFDLDDTFELTKTMLGVVRVLNPPGSLCVPEPDAVTIDTASVLLVVSCWHRLADIYESLFTHIRRCAEQSVLPVAALGRPVSLPSVRIGSYVPESTTSILLQMVATLHHSTQLANAMSDLASNLEVAMYPQIAVFVPATGADNTTCTEIRHRATGFHQQVKLIMEMLMHAGIF